MPIDDIEDTEENTVMILDGKDDAVIKGTGMLPLHRDGILRDRAVDLIMIYCPFDTDGEGSGRTLLCDQVHALATMPPSLRTELQTRGLAYKTSEPGFFRNGFYETWKVIPAIRSTPEREYLNVALAFDNDSNKAWDVYFPDTPKENSDKLLRNLADHLNDPTYTYQHRWKKGDLLVFDNMRTLHGRTAILPGHKRVVWRIQLQGPFTSGSAEC
jgi:alpha-ketoglutarate-dependent taurine dioxygenase